MRRTRLASPSRSRWSRNSAGSARRNNRAVRIVAIGRLAGGREPDVVFGPLAVFARAYRDFVDREAGLLHAFGERRVGAGRPDREDAAGAKRRPRARQPACGVEAVIGLASQAVGAVVDVEQDRVVAAMA